MLGHPAGHHQIGPRSALTVILLLHAYLAETTTVNNQLLYLITLYRRLKQHDWQLKPS